MGNGASDGQGLLTLCAVVLALAAVGTLTFFSSQYLPLIT